MLARCTGVVQGAKGEGLFALLWHHHLSSANRKVAVEITKEEGIQKEKQVYKQDIKDL